MLSRYIEEKIKNISFTFIVIIIVNCKSYSFGLAKLETHFLQLRKCTCHFWRETFNEITKISLQFTRQERMYFSDFNSARDKKWPESASLRRQV